MEMWRHFPLSDLIPMNPQYIMQPTWHAGMRMLTALPWQHQVDFSPQSTLPYCLEEEGKHTQWRTKSHTTVNTGICILWVLIHQMLTYFILNSAFLPDWFLYEQIQHGGDCDQSLNIFQPLWQRITQQPNVSILLNIMFHAPMGRFQLETFIFITYFSIVGPFNVVFSFL